MNRIKLCHSVTFQFYFSHISLTEWQSFNLWCKTFKLNKLNGLYVNISQRIQFYFVIRNWGRFNSSVKCFSYIPNTKKCKSDYSIIGQYSFITDVVILKGLIFKRNHDHVVKSSAAFWYSLTFHKKVSFWNHIVNIK